MRLHIKCIAAALAALPAVSSAQETQLGEVRVTSTTIDDRFAGKRSEPSTTHDISGKTVDEKRPENLLQILQSIPGVTADTSSGDELKIKLRGIENQRYMGEKPGVAIVIDGVPVFERTGKVNIDLDNIESIKVIKGGASYLFGEDALTGAVIITTKRGAKYKGYAVGADQGSWGYNRQLARAGFSNDWGSGHIQATHRANDDYYWQAAYKTNYIDGNLRLFLTDTSDLTFGFEKSDRTKDKHGSVTGAVQASFDPRGTLGRDYTRMYDVDLQKLHMTYSNDLSEKSNVLATIYEYRDHTTFWSSPTRYDATGAQVPTTRQEAYNNLNDYHQVQRGFKGEWRASAGDIAWLAGLDGRRNEYKNFDTVKTTYCPKAACATYPPLPTGTILDNNVTKEKVNAAYGELKFAPAPQWTVTGNGRFDNLGLDYTTGAYADSNGITTPAYSRSKSFNVSSWRGGANYEANKALSFFGNVSTGFRAPTAAQLYSGTSTPSGSAKAEPNENLKPERALNVEFGTRAKTNLFGVAFDAEAALFRITRKSFILATSGQYGVVDVGQKEKYENIGGVRNQGVELSLKSDRNRPWTLDVAYTYIEAVFTAYDRFYQYLGNQYASACGGGFPSGCYRATLFNNTGNYVPRVPRHQLNTTVGWQPFDSFRLALEADAKSWSYADEINVVKLPGRTLFNLQANYDVKGSGIVAGTKWSFFARVDNLFDRNYWSTARGTNDASSYATPTAASTTYSGRYDANDLSIIVGKPRFWTAGVTANF